MSNSFHALTMRAQDRRWIELGKLAAIGRRIDGTHVMDSMITHRRMAGRADAAQSLIGYAMHNAGKSAEPHDYQLDDGRDFSPPYEP